MFCLVQSCPPDEPGDTNVATSEVDNVPILSTPHEQLPNVPMYTATDYERMLKYKNTNTLYIMLVCRAVLQI